MRASGGGETLLHHSRKYTYKGAVETRKCTSLGRRGALQRCWANTQPESELIGLFRTPRGQAAVGGKKQRRRTLFGPAAWQSKNQQTAIKVVRPTALRCAVPKLKNPWYALLLVGSVFVVCERASILLNAWL